MSTAKCSMEIAPSNFQGSIAVHRTHLKAVCSSSRLTLSPDNPIPGSSKLLKRKDNSSQNYDRRLGVRSRYRHSSAPWFRKLHLIPFRITVPHPPREMDLHRFTGFHRFLRTDSLSTDCRFSISSFDFTITHSYMNLIILYLLIYLYLSIYLYIYICEE